MKRLSLFIILLASFAWSHPHVFVDATIKAIFDKTGFIAVENHWVYDELYSAAMFSSADKDSDGKLSSDETTWLEHAILDPLASSNYFDYVLKSNEFLKANGIEKFKAALVNGKLTLDFWITYSEPATDDYTMLVIVVSDLSNYVLLTTDMSQGDVIAPDEMDVEFFDDALEGLTMMRAFRSDVRGLYLRYKKAE